MSRKVSRNVIGSVSGIEAEKKEMDAPEDIHSDPANTEVGERDSGDELDPSVTEPVEGDGNVNGLQIQSNETIASDNPTNAEVAEANELVDDQSDDTGEPDLFATDDPTVDEDEEIVLSDEEIAEAARALAAGEDKDDTPEVQGDDTPAPVVNPEDPEHVSEDNPEVQPTIEDNATTGPVVIATQESGGTDFNILEDDDENDGELAPAHNGEGHRNTFINRHGNITVMDDETAERFYVDPKFYSYTYDAVEGKNAHVSTLRWSDARGRAVGGVVGDSYELDK